MAWILSMIQGNILVLFLVMEYTVQSASRIRQPPVRNFSSSCLVLPSGHVVTMPVDSFRGLPVFLSISTLRILGKSELCHVTQAYTYQELSCTL